MEARNRPIPEWFNRIKTGQLKLPRFQRFEAWTHNEVGGLLETVLRGLPSGATLILEVGDRELFASRPIVGSPPPTERTTEHLLDGQQRLTALWRSLNDNYEERTYFVSFSPDSDGDSEVPSIVSQARWVKEGRRYPVWADKPDEVWRRGLVPVKLLRPGDFGEDIETWCDSATGGDVVASRSIERKIQQYKQRIHSYNIPFLSLPVTTPKHVALEVFIKMNTSSVRLTAFDIVVAQVEEVAGQSLHALVAGLRAQVPSVDQYVNPEDLVLNVAALSEDKPPSQAGIQRLNLDRMVADWDVLTAGIKWAVEVLEEEHVFDGSRLPTVAVLPVLAALHRDVPLALDGHGNAKTLVRKYLWRSFLTRRYEHSVHSRSLQDYRTLRSVLREGAPEARVPIFDESQYPLPTTDELMRAGWPQNKDVLARGMLALSIKAGAQDLADGTLAKRSNLRQREYHHLFPVSLLSGDGALDDSDVYRALNCALITWSTNRRISAKEPVAYLRERTVSSTLGEAEIKARLASHLIPFQELSVGGFDQIPNKAVREHQIRSAYSAFLSARATAMMVAITDLCAGRNWPNPLV